MATGHPNARALEMWRQVRRYSRVLGQKPPQRLLELAEKAKFSQHTLCREECLELETFLKEAGAALRQKKWYLRWPIRLVFAIE